MKLSGWLLVCMGLLCTHLVVSDDAVEDEDVDIEDAAPPTGDDGEEEINVPKVERPIYKLPKVQGNAYLAEAFESEASFKKRWVMSSARKDDTDDEIAKYDGKWSIEEPSDNPLQNDLGLVLKGKAKHHAVSTKLNKPFKFDGKPFIVQYEVKFQNGQDCGGAYIKLLTDGPELDLHSFKDKTPFTIMFGPDKCGNDDKLHFIFRHKNPVTGVFEEKHAKKPSASLGLFFTDKKTHLYRLTVTPDNNFDVSVDHNTINSGSLLSDVEPAVNPPKEIVDPEDKKPADWDDKEKISDPDATKPDDWDESQPEYITDPDAVKPEGWLDDEPELVPDPDSEKPSDWDDDMDGEWEPAQINNPACEAGPGCGEWNPAQIKNPAYKGKWKAAMIDNPNYKGKWKARMIENPDYFEDNDPYMMTAINAVGLELWSMSDDILFDNFLITDDAEVADKWAADSFDLKVQQELSRSSGKSVVDAVMDMTNERPWLWAVILLVVVLPVVLIIAYCCSSGSSSSKDEAAQRKKTDASSPDDKEADDEEEEEEDKKDDDESSRGAGPGGDAEPKMSPKKEQKKTTKGDLETEEAQEADAEEDDDDDDEESTETKTTPRKRKTRARKD